MSSGRDRILSLDVFRGITIAGMLIVNNPGTWEKLYSPLAHAQWHGLTPADLIFPFFLFIAGVAMSFSFKKRVEKGTDVNRLIIHSLRRFLILFGLGLILNSGFSFDLSSLRIPGVLQRIGICFFLTSIIILKMEKRGQIITGSLLLLCYWLIVKLIPVPGYGAGNLSFEGNACGYIDTILLKGHLYKPAFDPEGLVTTLPAVVTMLCGVFTGDYIRKEQGNHQLVLNGLYISGTIMLLTGYIWTIWLPVNKKIWTNSYVFVTAGLASLLLGLCYWLIEMKNYRTWAKPFLYLGTNAITAYFLASSLQTVLDIIAVDGLSLNRTIYESVFMPLGNGEFSSFLFALFFAVFWISMMGLLYRKKIFIKV